MVPVTEETKIGEQQAEVKATSKSSVHAMFARSYAFYFLVFLAGIIFDFIFPFRLVVISSAVYFGFILLVSGPILIFWAQKATRKFQKDKNSTGRNFYCGPYYFTRSPTNFGVLFLLLGFGILANAFFVIVFTLIAFLVTKFTFLRKEERLLEQRYGESYLEYKKTVKF